MPSIINALKPVSWLVCGGAAASIVAAPIAGADPVFPTAGTESASATVMDLQAQGFDVVINWLQGHPNVPLSECRVNGINNPSHMAPNPATLSNVYVDVVCPNAK
jgi:hypothetical protein